MNIAYVHTGRWPSNSPSMTFATMTATGFAEAGHTCHFFIRRNSSDDAATVFRKVFDRDPPAGLHVHQVSMPSVLRTNRLFHWRVSRTLRAMARAGTLDVVMSRACTFLPSLARLRSQLGVLCWFESHDFHADLSLRDTAPGATARRNSALEQRYLPEVDGLVCLQNAQRKLYERALSGVRAVVARTGVTRIVHGDLSQRRCVGYVGSTERHKGVELLVRAAASSRTRPPVLVVGGKTASEVEAVEAMAVEAGYGEHTEVTGWEDKAGLDHHLRRIRVGVVPLRDTFFNRHVTSPLKLFDFYGYGIPVIGADLPTMRELVEPGVTGELFQPDSVEALAEAIDRQMELSDDAYAERSVKVYARAGDLLWTKRAEQLVDAFSSGMKEHS